MTIYGANTDSGCGITAMAILLQYYNDNSQYYNRLLPDHFDYKKGGIENANRLRGYSLDDNGNAPNNYTEEDTSDLFRLTPRMLPFGNYFDEYFGTTWGNIVGPNEQAEGLNAFFNQYCPNLNIGAYSQVRTLTDESDIEEAAKAHIDAGRPVLLSMLSYDYNNCSSANYSRSIVANAHVVVAYGYKVEDGKTKFIAHSGWGHETSNIFSRKENGDPFLYGLTYIDIPLEWLDISFVDENDENSKIYIDGLNYNHYGELLIPKKVNGYEIQGITASAFANMMTLTRVVFCENSQIESIGAGAFQGCTSLSSVVLSTGLTSIATNTFAGCSALSSITIPSSVTTIGNNAFHGSGLTTITIPNSLTGLGNGVFYNCTELWSINIPNNLSEIGEDVFENCYALTSVTLSQEATTYYEDLTLQLYSSACTIYTDGTVEEVHWFIEQFEVPYNVFYGCTFSGDGEYVVSMLAQEFDADIPLSPPHREGYVFVMWDSDDGYYYTMDQLVNATGTLYTIWTPVD